jgi:hypothetical protein
MEDRLSRAQKKALDAKRAPWKHALERLQERHMPGADYVTLEVLATLAMGAIDMGGRNLTSRVVTVENAESVVVEVDAFDDRRKILMVMNPLTRVPRTVLPAED